MMEQLTILFQRVRRGLQEVLGLQDNTDLDSSEVERIAKEVDRVVQGVFTVELAKR